MKKNKGPKYFEGANVVVQARIVHINSSGTVDIMLQCGKVIFDVDIDEVGLITNESWEKK